MASGVCRPDPLPAFHGILTAYFTAPSLPSDSWLRIPGYPEPRVEMEFCLGLPRLPSSTTDWVAYTTGIDSPPVCRLEGWCWQSCLLLRAVREHVFLTSLLASGGLLAVLGVPWLLDASPRFLPSSSSDVLLVCLCVQNFPFR